MNIAELKREFPLCSLTDVLQLFRRQLQQPEPNLALLSIVSGFLESTLISRFNDNQSGTGVDTLSTFPVLEWELVETLYKKFQTILSVIEPGTGGKGAKPSKQTPLVATREIIKRVSDLIWNSLIRSTYKDRALQSLFSYLSLNKLDCFGVAFAVVAGCQLLGYQGVHLAISEDHVWVVFGPEEQRETIQVTWHGKVFEDKRGESVEGADSKSWLYLAGCPVVCDRFMEISALVLAINPSLNLTCACLEVTELQKSLLWLLYDHGHLERYPMGLGNLGELEEFVTSSSAHKRPTSEELYRQSVRSSRKWYHNYHVYPYTYQGNYYYRKLRYREAFAAWASAGDVIRRYVYSSKDDEEIYKELLDIANEQIPSIMKTESSGHSARSILRDSRCFANLLRFYDGICKWEEGSLTPILHIGWAKPITSTIGKYDYDIRSQVIIHAADDDEEIPEVAAEEVDTENNGVGAAGEANNNSLKTANNNSTGGGVGGSSLAKVELPPRLAALTAACGEKLLNPNFLTGGEEQPFTTTDGDSAGDNVQKGGDSSEDKKEVMSMKQEVLASPSALVVDHDDEPRRPVIKLFSQKMKGLRNLLLGEKLNTQAILLQMTAQSQVGAGKKANRGSTNDTSAKGDDVSAGGGVGGGSSSVGNNTTSALNDGEVTSSGRPKRSRRE